MHTGKEFRLLTYGKIKTVKRLIRDGEYAIAAYLMGYILECALKAASCKALRLSDYPPLKSRKGRMGEGFRTHEFEQLLIVSGLSDLFGDLSMSQAYENWSAFTASYPGNWTEMRYDDDTGKFAAATVKELARNLYDDNDSIIETIKKKQRW